jgi:molybdopterin-guanine dinucleotide biosynthesis protein A
MMTKGSKPLAGYVLAGGLSRRFGADKALARLGGETILARLCLLLQSAAGDVWVVAPRGRYLDQRVRLIDDRWPGEGPLGGIVTALGAGGSDPRAWSLIVSCDMPFLTAEWLCYLGERAATSGADVVYPRSRNGDEPLCACWRNSAGASLGDAFDGGIRKVSEGMKRLRTEILDERDWKRFDSAGRLFWNMNTQQDYEAALRAWEMERS